MNCVIGSGQIFLSDQPPSSSENKTLIKSHTKVVRLISYEMMQKLYYVRLIAAEQSECSIFSSIRYRLAKDDTANSIVNLEEGVTLNYKLERKLPYHKDHNSNIFSYTASNAGLHNFVVMELEGIVSYRVK